MHALRRALTAALAAVVLVAAPRAWAAERPASEPYDIHVILSLTGGGAFLGKAEIVSMQLAEKVVNSRGGIGGRLVRFVFHDDQTSPQLAVQLANQAIATHPAVVIGGTLVAACNALMPLFLHGPVLYCFTPGSHPPVGSYVYSANTSTTDLTIAAIRYYRLRGWTRVATMTSTDATGHEADGNLKMAAGLPENAGVTIVAEEHFNPTDVSVAAQIAHIKEARPQLFYAWSTGASVATLLRAAKQEGLDMPVATTDGNQTYAQMKQFAGFLPRELYFQTSPWPVDGDPRVKMDPAIAAKQKEFYDLFRSQGVEPDQGSVIGWQPAMLVTSVLQTLGANATAAQVQDYLQHLKGFPSIVGFYDFEKTPQRGLGIDNAIMTRWNAGRQRWEAVSQVGGVPLEN
jgi:branched-chain amino acid transport system substrate-binding protein